MSLDEATEIRQLYEADCKNWGKEARNICILFMAIGFAVSLTVARYTVVNNISYSSNNVLLFLFLLLSPIWCAMIGDQVTIHFLEPNFSKRGVVSQSFKLIGDKLIGSYHLSNSKDYNITQLTLTDIYINGQNITAYLNFGVVFRITRSIDDISDIIDQSHCSIHVLDKNVRITNKLCKKLAKATEKKVGTAWKPSGAYIAIQEDIATEQIVIGNEVYTVN